MALISVPGSMISTKFPPSLFSPPHRPPPSRGHGQVIRMRGGSPQVAVEQEAISHGFGRHSFPPAFTFGSSSSAYQIEGGWNIEGKGPSIWDTFTNEHPEKIADQSNGNIANDSIHRFKEDVKLVKDLNMDAYRFSIAWSRILPKGSLKGGINLEGIRYYNKLIDDCLANGITPYVTIFHWDVPQELENKYQGFLSNNIVNDFKDYCDVCFREFGDRVKHWIILNEPHMFTVGGYADGRFAPGRCSPELGCPAGDSLTEPYIVAHNLILCHATAARLYRDNYKVRQGGKIGLALDSFWYQPFNEVFNDNQAAQRALDFELAWFLEPLVDGDYPFSMKSIVRERLPSFSDDEKKMIKGSFDFVGINYYTARFAKNKQYESVPPPTSYAEEKFAELLRTKDGIPIGPSNGSWINVYPKGINELLMYIKERFKNPEIYITENGYSDAKLQGKTREELMKDEARRQYVEHHLHEVLIAIRNGANVAGYFVWSLNDSFEWNSGYTLRFGLNYVDYSNLNRYPKESAKWLSKILRHEPVAQEN